MHISLCVVVVLVYFFTTAKANETGLEFSGSVDAVGQFALNPHSSASDKFSIREVEATVYGPIDPYFDGVLSAAAHEENGVSLFEIHEAYIETARLIPGVQVKAGQFFLGIGRIAQVHRHDWPFISAPRVHRELFSAEGLIDSGIEISTLLPTEAFWDLKLGVANGWVHGHSHSEGTKPKHPSLYARTSHFISAGSAYGWLLGGSFLKRHTADDFAVSYLGMDLTYKGVDSKHARFLLQSELWYQLAKGDDSARGAYVFVEWRVGGRSYLGQRFDFYESLPISDTRYVEYTTVSQYSFAASEFSRLRLAVQWDYLDSDLASEKELNNLDRVSVETQFVYILGAHPSHDF